MSAFTRRAVLMAGGAAAVLGAALSPRAAEAAPLPLVWRDESLPPSRDPADTVLRAELVAQWRAELRALLSGGGQSATALVRWDKAMVLAGLAREEGWKARTHRLGQGVFRVDIIV